MTTKWIFTSQSNLQRLMHYTVVTNCVQHHVLAFSRPYIDACWTQHQQYHVSPPLLVIIQALHTDIEHIVYWGAVYNNELPITLCTCTCESTLLSFSLTATSLSETSEPSPATSTAADGGGYENGIKIMQRETTRTYYVKKNITGWYDIVRKEWYGWTP